MKRRRGSEDPGDPISGSEDTQPLSQPTTLALVGFADGACRGNPGPASWGAVLLDAHGINEVWQGKGMLEGSGRTNNEAEYTAACECAERAVRMGAASLHLSLDSDLVVKQFSGENKVRNARLQVFHKRLALAGAKLQTLELQWVPRECNARADELANLALDEASAQPQWAAKRRQYGWGLDDALVGDTLLTYHSQQSQQSQQSPQRDESAVAAPLGGAPSKRVQFQPDQQHADDRAAAAAMQSQSSYPGTQYPSDDDDEDGMHEGPRVTRLGHGEWRRLCQLTIDWSETCRSTSGACATVLGLVVHAEPPRQQESKDGRLFDIAKLMLQDGKTSEDKMEITLFGEQSRHADGVQAGDIVQISQVYFKKWGQNGENFGGNASSSSELLIACKAGSVPARDGPLPQYRVYSRAELTTLYSWALNSSGYGGYLTPRAQQGTNRAARAHGATVTWQDCSTTSELAGSGSGGGLVCFGGTFTDDSRLRFYRDRNMTTAALEEEAQHEKHMPSKNKAAKRREGAVTISRGVRLTVIDGRHALSAAGSGAQGATGAVVIAVHHQSVALFRTAVAKGEKIMNFALKPRNCVSKSHKKRGSVYQNHTQTRNYALTMMNFAGQCYVLTALQQASEEESADALEPVLHTTAATKLTPIDMPYVQASDPGALELPSRLLSVSEVLAGGTGRRSREQPRSAGLAALHEAYEASPTRDDSDCEAEAFSDLQTDPETRAKLSDESEDDEDPTTLSLDSFCMDSSEEEDFAPVDLPESSPLRASQIDDTMQMAPIVHANDRADGGAHAEQSSGDVTAARHVESGRRLRCAAYGRSIGLQLPSVGSEDEDGWRSLLCWRCDRVECAHECPFTTDVGAAKVQCDRCGDMRTVSLCGFSITLSGSSPGCDGHCNDNGEEASNGEGLGCDVLPSALSSLFCGLLTPELVASAHTAGSAEARGIRARVREAVWALSNSGSRLVFILEDRLPMTAMGRCTDSQGYGIETGSGGGGSRYDVVGIDWSTILPLDNESSQSSGYDGYSNAT